MTLKNNLESIVRKLDNTYLAWGVFIASRLGDTVSTVVNYELDQDITQERNHIARFFMENLDFYPGIITHNLVGATVLISAYILLSYTRFRNYRNIIPYPASLFSIGAFLGNTLPHIY